MSPQGIPAVTTLEAPLSIDNRGSMFVPIEQAIEELKAGKFLVVLDNEDRENEGDLIMPAACATPEALAFMIRYTSGVICAPTTAQRVKELEFPLMVAQNTEAHKCAFTVSVDLKAGTSTGISASDRSKTIRAIGDPSAKAEDFNRPGHIFPLVAVDGGVLQRAGHTESAVDLARLAGFFPAGYICEINNDDGTMMRREHLEVFCKEHSISMITITDLIKYRLKTEKLITPVTSNLVSKNVVTPFGKFDRHQFTSAVDNATHDVLVYGNVAAESQNHNGVLVHIVDQTLEGSFSADWAKKAIADNGAGVLIYFNGRERLEEVSGKEMASVSIVGLCGQMLESLGIHKVSFLGESLLQNYDNFAVEVSSHIPLTSSLSVCSGCYSPM